MIETRPILEDVRIVDYSGRYAVRLEVPSDSTLTGPEIERVLALASWKVDPKSPGAVEGYEGGRAVLIKRERPTGRLQLGRLEISGMGYRGVSYSGEVRGIGAYSGEDFMPPCTQNFMDRVKGTAMATSISQNGKLLLERPTYRALGAYLEKELEIKVKKTQEASRLGLKTLETPRVEAYGRYLSPELSHEGMPLGFFVFAVPDEVRIGETILEILGKTDIRNIPDVAKCWTVPLAKGLKELHDNARIAHLQPHLGNLYLVGGVPYLVDWSSSVRLGENREDNIMNRVIDLSRPAENIQSLFLSLFGGAAKNLAGYLFLEMQRRSMEAYSEKSVNMMEVMTRRTMRMAKTDPEFICQWMKDEGLEGFPKHIPKSVERFELECLNQVGLPGKDVGRNDPCSCGSGRKYKKCCGGH